MPRRNATPAGDGVPNWLKYTLGLDPHVAGVVVPDGVVWANGKCHWRRAPTPSTSTPPPKCRSTRKWARPTRSRRASSVSGGWQNIGNADHGTGTAVSYVTPTRQNVQQFYRVMATP